MPTNAFDQGKLAYRNNFSMSSCDYPTGSTLRDEWMKGWTQARGDDERKTHGESSKGLMSDARRAKDLGRSSAHES